MLYQELPFHVWNLFKSSAQAVSVTSWTENSQKQITSVPSLVYPKRKLTALSKKKAHKPPNRGKYMQIPLHGWLAEKADSLWPYL